MRNEIAVDQDGNERFAARYEVASASLQFGPEIFPLVDRFGDCHSRRSFRSVYSL